MKLIKKLIISLIFIVAILGVVVISGYIYIRKTYGIDLYNLYISSTVRIEKTSAYRENRKKFFLQYYT